MMCGATICILFFCAFNPSVTIDMKNLHRLVKLMTYLGAECILQLPLEKFRNCNWFEIGGMWLRFVQRCVKINLLVLDVDEDDLVWWSIELYLKVGFVKEKCENVFASVKKIWFTKVIQKRRPIHLRVRFLLFFIGIGVIFGEMNVPTNEPADGFVNSEKPIQRFMVHVYDQIVVHEIWRQCIQHSNNHKSF